MSNLEKIVERIKIMIESRGRPILVAIDGRSGVGKSTFAKRLGEKVKGVIITGDDFYSGGSDEEWNKLSPKEKVEKCIDWKRMGKEVLKPLLSGKSASWHPFNFNTGKGLSSEVLTAKPSSVILLDGAYSSRPELDDLIDLSVLVEADNDNRREMLTKREGVAFMGNWHNVWDVAEDYYFTHVRPKKLFNFIIQNDFLE